MDNPLFEGSWETEPNLRPMNFYAARSPVHAEAKGRMRLAQLSLDESQGSKISRRIQALSLSAWEYEGMCRALQENVCESSQNSVSALEDFKEFRQKLANLKEFRHPAAKDELAPNLPPILAFSGSIRSLNLGSVSARALSLSPSQSTTPLKRLSVLTSRKGVSGLNPLRDSQPGEGGGAGLPPSVQRFARTVRAEGLFKLPSPASISPVSTEYFSAPPPPPPTDADTNPPSPDPSSRRRFSSGRGAAADSDHRRIPFKAATTTARAADANSAGTGRKRTASGRQTELVSNDESVLLSCAPRLLAFYYPKTLRNAPGRESQVSRKETEKMSAPSCSIRARDLKARCIHMPRPLCYSPRILE